MKNQIEENYTIHTSVDNESAELVKMACTNCGASLTIVDKTHAKCPFCGQTYLIDEAKGIVVNVNVDYGNSAEVRQSVKKTQRLIIGFFIAAVVVTAIILAFNIAANKSVFSSSDSDAPVQENGNLLVIFCKDIFQKEYRDITPEEFGSIRYIRYTYQRDGNSDDHYHVVYYSFTNYEDCESEEEFLDTVSMWTYEDSKASWPSDFTMLTGLTRIDTTNSLWMSLINFSENCKISYVTTDDNLETVSSRVNPEYVKVLDLGTFSNNLNGLEQYKNLEVLKAQNTHLYNTTDLSGIGQCSKLRQLELNCADAYEGAEEIAELSELTSLSMNGVLLPECEFLKEMPQLEELTMDVGEDADLSILSYLPNLKKLDTGNDDIVSAKQLLVLSNLEDLTVSVDTLENIALLAELKKLKSLHLDTSYWEVDENYDEVPIDISIFSQLPELEYFYISRFSGGGFCGVESILNLPALKCFGVSVSALKEDFNLNREELIENSSLETFYLENVCACDSLTGEEGGFEFLSNYPNLKELWLQDCDLADISFASGLKNLERCHFEKNEITDYSPLKECKKLEYLCVGLDSSEVRPDVAEDVQVDWDLHFFGKE